MNSVPDYVPMLRAGATKNPQLGGCLVQIANWLADPTIWTDKPAHVHPVLAAWATNILFAAAALTMLFTVRT